MRHFLFGTKKAKQCKGESRIGLVGLGRRIAGGLLFPGGAAKPEGGWMAGRITGGGYLLAVVAKPKHGRIASWITVQVYGRMGVSTIDRLGPLFGQRSRSAARAPMSWLRPPQFSCEQSKR